MAKAKIIIRRDGRGNVQISGRDMENNREGPAIKVDNSQRAIDETVRQLKEIHERAGIRTEVKEM